jgi:hypothetical protein
MCPNMKIDLIITIRQQLKVKILPVYYFHTLYIHDLGFIC